MRMIDADALNDAMYHEAFENDASYNERNPMAKWDSGLWIRYKLFENTIDEAPTIEPNRGEWEEKETFSVADDDPIIERWQSARCSMCERYHTTPYMYYFNDYNFCPYCGADMRERKESE